MKNYVIREMVNYSVARSDGHLKKFHVSGLGRQAVDTKDEREIDSDETFYFHTIREAKEFNYPEDWKKKFDVKQICEMFHNPEVQMLYPERIGYNDILGHYYLEYMDGSEEDLRDYYTEQ